MTFATSTIGLKYGHRDLRVVLPVSRAFDVCAPRHARGLPEPEAAVRASLRAPVGSAPLRDKARGGRSAVVLISARDRVTGSDCFVKVIADELNAAGIPDGAIEVVLASGTHQKQTEEDVRSLLGPEAAGRLRVVHHDPRDQGSLIALGATSFGTPIFVNRRVYESDVKVLTGRVAHHYFAGFSGGRKSIAPGVSGFETILANHRRVMNPQGDGLHPDVHAGSLTHNPVHLDMLEIARAAAPTFCVNTALNVDHAITHVFAGDYLQAHRQGCGIVDSLFRIPPRPRAGIVIASCGGWPYDISFMQVIKTIVAAERAVADRGVLIVLGECERGLEPGFHRWFAHGSLEELGKTVVAEYDLKGHNSYWIRTIQQRIHIVLVSALPAADVAALGMLHADDADSAIRLASSLAGTGAVLAVPHGNLTVFS
jgi:nickel-dependent lactate racemase